MSLLLILVFGGLVSVWNWKMESKLTKLTVQNNALERAIQNQNDVINQLLTKLSQLECAVVRSTPNVMDSTTQNLMDSMTPNIIESCASEDCEDIRSLGYDVSGVYGVNAGNGQIARVYCEMTSDGKAWTRILHRQDNLTDFVYKNWAEYEAGFGDPEGSHWMGLVQMHQLTTDHKYKLRVDLEDWDGYTAYAEYSTFSLGSAKLKYRLFIGNYSGTAGASLDYHNDSRFSTIDQDNNLSDINCNAPGGMGESTDSEWYTGGWWWPERNCWRAILTGAYLKGYRFHGHVSGDRGIKYVSWRGWGYSYRVATMKMQRL